MKISYTDVIGVLACIFISLVLVEICRPGWLDDHLFLPAAEWWVCNISHTGFHCQDPDVRDAQEVH